MLDIIIIALALFSFVMQLVVSFEILFYKVKCRNGALDMATNLWFDYIPHLLLLYSLFIGIYSIKYSDTFMLLMVISLTIIFIFNIQIFIYNKEYTALISFPFCKEEYDSFVIQDKCILVENEKRKKCIHLSRAKINKIAQVTMK